MTMERGINDKGLGYAYERRAAHAAAEAETEADEAAARDAADDETAQLHAKDRPYPPAVHVSSADVEADFGRQAQSWPVAVLSGVAVLGCSGSIIYLNAWILDDSNFPYVCTYVAVQQMFCCCAALLLTMLPLDKLGRRVARGTRWFDSTFEENTFAENFSRCKHYFGTFGPLALCFALYLYGSNTAYKYLRTGLIQMVKPIGSCLVFSNACIIGLERYSRPKAFNLLLICCGTLITSLPALLSEGASTDSTTVQVTFGFCALVGAYLCDSYYVVGLQLLQSGGWVHHAKLDPISTMLNIAPLAAILLTAAALLSEPGSWSHLQALPPGLWLAAGCAALGFNLALMNFIGRLSATTYVIFDYGKDAVIISAAFLFFAEDFERNELLGYVIVLTGAVMWQHRKLYPAGGRHKKKPELH